MRRLGIAGWLLLGVAGWSFAQTATATTPSSPSATNPTGPTAAPYKEDEFPSWALKLRRFEIITVGAFPIMYLFTGVGYDYGYYVASGFSQTYIPWPVGQGTSQWTSTNNPDLLQSKNITVISVALGLSLVVAGVDWFLGL